MPVLASRPPALVQLKGNLIRKRNSVRTNIQFGNLLRVGVFFFFFNTLEGFALILLLGLLIKRDELFRSQRNPYIEIKV